VLFEKAEMSEDGVLLNSYRIILMRSGAGRNEKVNYRLEISTDLSLEEKHAGKMEQMRFTR